MHVVLVQPEYKCIFRFFLAKELVKETQVNTKMKAIIKYLIRLTGTKLGSL